MIRSWERWDLLSKFKAPLQSARTYTTKGTTASSDESRGWSTANVQQGHLEATTKTALESPSGAPALCRPLLFGNRIDPFRLSKPLVFLRIQDGKTSRGVL